MLNDFIITLAWPEGMVAGSGGWYDKIISKKGMYRVGHSAMILINSATKKTYYFDFGRYHTPKGFGRVRDAETDPDVALIDAEIKNKKLINLEELLLETSAMKATHGEGKMYASLLGGINFDNAFFTAKTIQQKGMVPYGPFTPQGTNCSRFVASVIKSSGISVIKKLRFKYPFCISPSPKRNVCITNHHYYVVENNQCVEVKKSILQAYFSSIEQ
tara:strand:- start:213 stop:860 length:648 start_codon:yes stop_codon:yes gene_type:complete